MKKMLMKSRKSYNLQYLSLSLRKKQKYNAMEILYYHSTNEKSRHLYFAYLVTLVCIPLYICNHHVEMLTKFENLKKGRHEKTFCILARASIKRGQDKISKSGVKNCAYSFPLMKL